MSDNYSPMSVIVEAAKKKGVRLNESDLLNIDSERLNENVIVFRGRLADVVYGLFERVECSLPAEKSGHRCGLDVNRDRWVLWGVNLRRGRK
jgi:hypothetical protein